MTEYQIELNRLNNLRGQRKWTLYSVQLIKFMNKYSSSLSERNIKLIVLEMMRQSLDLGNMLTIDTLTERKPDTDYDTHKKEVARIKNTFGVDTRLEKSTEGFLLIYIGQSKGNFESRKVYKRLRYQFPKIKNEFKPISGRWNINDIVFYEENKIDSIHKIDFIKDVYAGVINQNLLSFGQTVDNLTSVIETEYLNCKNTVLYFEKFEANKIEHKIFFLENLLLELIELILTKNIKIDKLKFYFEDEEDVNLFNNIFNELISLIEIKNNPTDTLNKLSEKFVLKLKSSGFKYLKEIQKGKSKLDSIANKPALEFRKKFSPNCNWLDEDFARIYQVRDFDDSILILGESGTGKGFLAELIHSESVRNNKPFFKFNCANVPESLIQSELFGHKKGAFTGAISDKKGIFEAADGGILFLDEIGEASWEVQSNLLTAIEDKIIKPVGAEKFVSVDVKLIFATNQDLDEMVSQKTFRKDLLNRMNAHQITLPPLRDRKEDVEELLYKFKPEFEKKYHTNLEITPEAVNKIKFYQLTGNIRELKNILEKCVAYSARNNKTRIDNYVISEIIPYSKQLDASLKLENLKQNLTDFFLSWKDKKDFSSITKDMEDTLAKMGIDKDRKSYLSFGKSVVEPILARIYSDLYNERTPGIIKDNASELIGLSWKSGDDNSKLTQRLKLYPILEKHFK